MILFCCAIFHVCWGKECNIYNHPYHLKKNFQLFITIEKKILVCEKKNALKYDLKPQGRPSAKIRQNYKMIKESISSIAFKGYQQIFAENMHTILIKRGSLKIHMERRGRGDSGGLFNAKFYKRINRKRLKLSRI